MGRRCRSTTYNRNLAIISSLFTWCVDNDLLPNSPAKGRRRRTIEAVNRRRAGGQVGGGLKPSTASATLAARMPGSSATTAAMPLLNSSH
jgi:hypothetical protein